MSEWLKNVAVGMLPLLALGVIFFFWIGIPMIWMSYTDAEGHQFTLLGTIWVLAPAVAILVGVFHWMGKSLRDKGAA
jgi:hypothetical protein